MGKTQSAGRPGRGRGGAHICGSRAATMLESQWRCRFGELDLVAQDKRGHPLLRGGQAPGRSGSIGPAPGGCGRPQAGTGSAVPRSLYLSAERARRTRPVRRGGGL